MLDSAAASLETNLTSDPHVLVCSQYPGEGTTPGGEKSIAVQCLWDELLARPLVHRSQQFSKWLYWS